MIDITKAKADAEEGLRIAEPATKGPWHKADCVSPKIVIYAVPQGPHGFGDIETLYLGETYCDTKGQGRANLAFIADSRTRAPDAYRNVIEMAGVIDNLNRRLGEVGELYGMALFDNERLKKRVAVSELVESNLHAIFDSARIPRCEAESTLRGRAQALVDILATADAQRMTDTDRRRGLERCAEADRLIKERDEAIADYNRSIANREQDLAEFRALSARVAAAEAAEEKMARKAEEHYGMALFDNERLVKEREEARAGCNRSIANREQDLAEFRALSARVTAAEAAEEKMARKAEEHYDRAIKAEAERDALIAKLASLGVIQ
jgi:tetratricopeptide (TPR) repeat protein